MLEATEENKEKLIDEVYRLWSEATGETATETKRRKIREYAARNNFEVVTKMPEGWMEVETMTAPLGSVRISNMRLSLKALHNQDRKEALLLLI